MFPENNEAELILPVFIDNELTFAPTFILLVINALLPTPRFNVLKLEAYIKLVEIELTEILLATIKLVLIVPLLFMFCEVRTLPKSSLPTDKLLKKPELAPILILLKLLIKPKVVERLLTEILLATIKLVLIVFTDRVPPSLMIPVPTIKLLVDIELVETLDAVTKLVLIVPLLLMFCEFRTLPKSSLPTDKLLKKPELAPILTLLMLEAYRKFVEMLFTDILQAVIKLVLRRFVLIFAVVTPPAGENPPAKFNVVNVAVPAFTVLNKPKLAPMLILLMLLI
jgi:hypothetical protein